MGIDYGRGLANIDSETGYRYGIIHTNKLPGWFWDEVEPVYPSVTCPECETENVYEVGINEYACEDCDITFFHYDDFDEPIWQYDKEGYQLSVDDHGDVWVFKSPFITQGTFCSPCAPGAVSLGVGGEDAWAYCLGPEWFDDENPCPCVVWWRPICRK